MIKFQAVVSNIFPPMVTLICSCPGPRKEREPLRRGFPGGNCECFVVNLDGPRGERQPPDPYAGLVKRDQYGVRVGLIDEFRHRVAQGYAISSDICFWRYLNLE